MTSAARRAGPQVVRDEVGLASLRARGVTKAITLYPEWLALGLKLDKFTAGGENRPRPPPAGLVARRERIALHAGKYVGGRPGGYNDGMIALLETAQAAGWMVSMERDDPDPKRAELSFGKVLASVKIKIPDDITTSAIMATAIIRGYMPPIYVPTATPWRVVSTTEEPSYLWLLEDIEILPKPIACPGSRGWWSL